MAHWLTSRALSTPSPPFTFILKFIPFIDTFHIHNQFKKFPTKAMFVFIFQFRNKLLAKMKLLRALFLLIMIKLTMATGGQGNKEKSPASASSSSGNPPPKFKISNIFTQKVSLPKVPKDLPKYKEKIDKLFPKKDPQNLMSAGAGTRLSLTDEEDSENEATEPHVLGRSYSFNSIKNNFGQSATDFGTRAMTNIKGKIDKIIRHGSENLENMKKLLSQFSISPEKESKMNVYKIHSEKIRKKYFPHRKGLREQWKHFIKIEKEKMKTLCNEEGLRKLMLQLEGNEEEGEGQRKGANVESTESHDEYGSLNEGGESYFRNSELPEDEAKALGVGSYTGGTSFFFERLEANRSFKKSESLKMKDKSPEIGKEEEAKKEKAQQSPQGLKGAIRLGLRKYFCDVYFNKMGDWVPGRGAKWEGKKMENVPETKEKHEWVFLRKNWGLAKEFAFDFRIWVIFPDKFKALVKQFKRATPKTLMLSLTEQALDGFDNPAASDSLFYKSWDGQFMLKSVQLIKKQFQKNAKLWEKIVNVFNIDMEPLIEKDFFFEDPVKWNMKDWIIKRFHNGLDVYMDHMAKMPKSLLPKFYGLFGIQTTKGAGEQEFEFLFTIQNFLLPTGSAIGRKFDLKGSTYKRKKEETEENLANEEMTWSERNYFRIPINDSGKNSSPEGFFRRGIVLEDRIWAQIFLQIEADTLFLRRLGILDYSLLLGVNQGNMKSKFGIEGIDPSQSDTENNVKILFGIIDILQTFVTRKKAESEWKSWIPPEKLTSLSFPYNKNGRQIYPLFTIIPPEIYRRRFRAYVTQVVFHPKDKANARKIVESMRGQYGIEEIDWKEEEQLDDQIEMPKGERPELASMRSEELSKFAPIRRLESVLGENATKLEVSTEEIGEMGEREFELQEMPMERRFGGGRNDEIEEEVNWGK